MPSSRASRHCVDYLSLSNASGNVRNQLRNESSEFATIDRVAHAFKHVKTGHPDAPTHRPLTVSDVFERPPAIYGQAVWGVARWDDAKGGVEIANEESGDLLDVVKRAAEFLKTKL